MGLMEVGKYDPKKHAGLIWAGEKVIVADANQAKLNEAPNDIRTGLAQLTINKLQEVTAVADFSRGIGSVIIQITDEQAVDDEIAGYAKGIALLGLNTEELKALGLSLSEQTEIYKLANK